MAKAKGPTYVVPFRRRKEKSTNYEKRLGLVKSGKPRMVVRRSNRHVLVQLVEFNPSGDKVLISVNSKKLKKFKWASRRNLPTAYLAGFYAGVLGKKAGIKEFVLDIGLVPPVVGGLPFAAQKGAVDAGLKSPHGENIVDDGRVKGAHIEALANSLSEAEYKKRFASYLKEGFDPKKFTSLFESAKEAISKE
ncbi:50S ribosomal protein L18 [Candidatus Micrarchaeota archaeon]|nr:50S ribosomal protein L18 [Candidatus Micrarchaeota archaeon]MBD3418287.1 50S ribosomal protein L18 [Candidatus Micrarchaeota archaeon]